MLLLPRVVDKSDLLQSFLPVTAQLIVDDSILEYDCVLLCSRSRFLEQHFAENNMLELDEFSGLKPQVLDCVTLLYGGAVIPTVDNIQAIMKFSVLYEVCDLYEISVNWASMLLDEEDDSRHYCIKLFKMGTFIKELDKTKDDMLVVCGEWVKVLPELAQDVLDCLLQEDCIFSLVLNFAQYCLSHNSVNTMIAWLDDERKCNIILRGLDSEASIEFLSDNPALLSSLIAKMMESATSLHVMKHVTSIQTRIIKLWTPVVKKAQSHKSQTNITSLAYNQSWKSLQFSELAKLTMWNAVTQFQFIEIAVAWLEAALRKYPDAFALHECFLKDIWGSVNHKELCYEYLIAIKKHVRSNTDLALYVLYEPAKVCDYKLATYGWYLSDQQVDNLIWGEVLTLSDPCKVKNCTDRSEHVMWVQLLDVPPFYNLDIWGEWDDIESGHVHDGAVVHWFVWLDDTSVVLSMITDSYEDLLAKLKQKGPVYLACLVNKTVS